MASERNTVFLVSGRDHAVRDSLVALLEAMGLHVVTWEEAISLTGTPSPHAQQVLQHGMSNADAAVVLFTGDDEARLREPLCGPDDERERRVQNQPRQNVLFEAGMAFALFPRATVVVQVGRLRHLSDLEGVQYATLDESPQSVRALLGRLSAAGLSVTEPDGIPAGIGRAVDGLPRVDDLASASVVFLKKVRSLLPFARLGGGAEIVHDAKVGERLTLSIRAPSGQPFAIDHWSPGATTPREVDLTSATRENDLANLPFSVPGPAGIHVFDVVAIEGPTLARIELPVSED